MNIGRISEASAQTSATAPKPAEQETQKKSNTLAADNSDKFVKSETVYTPAYTKASAGKSNTNALSDKETETVGSAGKSFIHIKNEAMKAMVSGTFEEQSIFVSSESTAVEEQTDDDYWGAEATAKRIYDFARNLAGDNDELFQTLKDAVNEGFKQAEKAFGKKYGKSELPDVCGQTYDKVMSLFDDWEKEIKAKKGVSSQDTDNMYIEQGTAS